MLKFNVPCLPLGAAARAGVFRVLVLGVADVVGILRVVAVALLAREPRVEADAEPFAAVFLVFGLGLGFGSGKNIA